MRKIIVLLSFLVAGAASATTTYILPSTLLWTAFNGITTTQTGTWQDVRYYNSCNCTITVFGALGAGTGASIWIDMSNTNTGSSVPNSFTHVGLPVGSVLNASSVITYSPIARFFKIRLEGNNTSTVSASCVFRSL